MMTQKKLDEAYVRHYRTMMGDRFVIVCGDDEIIGDRNYDDCDEAQEALDGMKLTEANGGGES